MCGLTDSISELISSIPGASLGETVDAIGPASGMPHPDAGGPAAKDLFAVQTRRRWNADGVEPRCDFSDGRAAMVFRSRDFGCMTLWRRSTLGQTLSEIKTGDANLRRFADAAASMIGRILGHNLAAGGWALAVPPPRRHTEANFAMRAASILADRLGIPFIGSPAICHGRGRVGAVYTLASRPPSQRNLIIFDDIITTGSTMQSMYNLLSPLGYNLFFIAGINNKA